MSDAHLRTLHARYYYCVRHSEYCLGEEPTAGAPRVRWSAGDEHDMQRPLQAEISGCSFNRCWKFHPVGTRLEYVELKTSPSIGRARDEDLDDLAGQMVAANTIAAACVDESTGDIVFLDPFVRVADYIRYFRYMPWTNCASRRVHEWLFVCAIDRTLRDLRAPVASAMREVLGERIPPELVCMIEEYVLPTVVPSLREVARTFFKMHDENKGFVVFPGNYTLEASQLNKENCDPSLKRRHRGWTTHNAVVFALGPSEGCFDCASEFASIFRMGSRIYIDMTGVDVGESEFRSIMSSERLGQNRERDEMRDAHRDIACRAEAMLARHSYERFAYRLVGNMQKIGKAKGKNHVPIRYTDTLIR